MTLAGYVYDAVAFAPVPSASLSIVDANGSPIGGGTAADAQGLFNITSPQFDSGAKLLVSSVGYTPVIVDPNVIVASGIIGLTPSAQTLQEAVVTPHRSSGKYLLYGAGGAIVLWAIWPEKKKRGRLGDMGSFDWTKIIVPGAIAVGVIVAGKAILQKLGLLSAPPSPTQQATTNAQAAALQQAQQQAASAGQHASYTQDQYTGWANDIYNIGRNQFWPISSGDQDTIVKDVINVNTMLDLQMLISAFGQRTGNCLVFDIDCTTYDLDGWLKALLDSTHLNTLNQYLSATGINYVF